MTTHIIVVLDESGSMSSIRQATMDGFNTFIREQRQFSEDAVVSLVKFATGVTPGFKAHPIHSVPPLSTLNYSPNGYTAMNDGIGHAIDVTSKLVRADRTIYAVLTDGQENQSRRYTRERVRQLIEAEQEAGNTFIFLAANINAQETGAAYGFNPANTYAFAATAVGTQAAYADMSRATLAARMVP